MEEAYHEITALQGEWRELAGRPRRDSAAEQIIGLLPAYPILDVEQAADIIHRSDEAARLALNRLADAGVIQSTTVAKGRRAWESVGLFALSDDIERRLSRGTRAPVDTQ